MQPGVCYLLVLGLAVLVRATESVKIISFNVENFSDNKYKHNQFAVDKILQIISDYDLILLLEMEDNGGDNMIMNGLLGQLNSNFADVNTFDKIVSDRLAKSDPEKSRSGRPEEYAFIYRTSSVQVVDHFQSQYTNFSRPPFTVLFKSLSSGYNFFVVPIHTKPRNTVFEIDSLSYVFSDAASRFNTKTGIIIGDMNCDCEFVSNKAYNNLILRKDPDFTWWIQKGENTGTKDVYKDPGCALDRIITHEEMTEHVINGTAGVVRFDKQLNLSHEKTVDVSDHFPVTITIQ